MKRPRRFRIPFLNLHGFVIPIQENSPLLISGTLTVETGVGRKRVKVSLPIALAEKDGILEGRAAISADDLGALLPENKHGEQSIPCKSGKAPVQKPEPKKRKLVKKAPRLEEIVPKPRKEGPLQVESKAQRARRERRDRRQ